jgi:putative oxidoreductase
MMGNILVAACRLLLGLIFVVAAAGKLAKPVQFMGDMAAYEMVPGAVLPWAASMLPMVEAVAGLVLLAGVPFAFSRSKRPVLGIWLTSAAWAVAGMLVMFIVALSVVILQGKSLDCGCFDMLGRYLPIAHSSKVDWGIVGRDFVMLAMAVPPLWRGR